MPSLHLVGQRRVVVGQLVVEVVIFSCVVQEGLARPPLKSTEVSIEVIRKLDRLAILKSFVEDLEDLVEGTSLLDLLNGEASLLAIRIFIT